MAVLLIVGVVAFIGLFTLCALSLGEYIARVLTRKTPGFCERKIYALVGINYEQEMSWKHYAFSFVFLSFIGIALLFLLQEIQQWLPFNPEHFGPVRWDTAINTAISFVTNTNWQAYAGESSLSYFTQMVGCTVQNFLSAGMSIAFCIACIRAFTRRSTSKIGNFWVDLTRTILYILLPLSLIFALVLVSQGVIQNLNPATHVSTLEGSEQIIAQGPAASQVAIKDIGTNGGGFFAANAAHPFENPTPLTDILHILAFLLIPAAFPFVLGKLLGSRKQGFALYLTMLTLYLGGLAFALWSETNGNLLLSRVGVAHGCNMEGKEVRFGPISSTVFAHATTATSCGAVNASHDSFMPLTNMILLFNMMVGEVIFGGAGVGLIGMLLYAILTMFIMGLMIGRTPEIFGKKLEPYEMIMAIIAVLAPSMIKLLFGALAISLKTGTEGLVNTGPHGLATIMYAFSSTAGNNGSAFAGLASNTLFYNFTTAIAMLVGRFALIIPSLALAGSLIQKRFTPEVSRFPTTSPLFVIILICTVLILGALTFFPVLVLESVLEHVMIRIGQTF